MMALDASVWSNCFLHYLHLPGEVSLSIVPEIRIMVGDSNLITILINISVVLVVALSMTSHRVIVTDHKRVEQGVLLVEIRTESRG